MTITNGKITRRNVVQGSAALGAGLATAGMLGRAPVHSPPVRMRRASAVAPFGWTLGEPATLDEHTTTFTPS